MRASTIIMCNMDIMCGMCAMSNMPYTILSVDR